ncbi:hypothetical protein SCHPADRAFT_945455 [Schizopora paradoxa]|uniref:BTB domain-containing protein n=1 Tax=Schizopora paradoxa TaxID=27342 RepID=A0A0H2RQW3_9AGAM|nr:hypothetical protein SCHPADRAFT_945455 [Schizopora paradoxa]
MPPKRRRTSENSQVQDAEHEENLATTKPQPYEDFWFEDGSIVLATDIHLYRVHKGMLAKYSKVLGDMFNFPTGDEDANTERWEDVPIVRMVGDSDEGVRLLLKALYGMNHVRGQTLSEVSLLLSISSKYDFQDVRTDVIQYLESLFPNTQEKYKASKIHSVVLNPDQLFDLLVVAHRFQALSILPVLYYLCARLPLGKTCRFLQNLPVNCMENFLFGRDWLCGVSQTLFKRSLQASRTGGKNQTICRSPACLEKFRSILAAKFPDGSPRFVFPLDLSERGILEGVVLGKCEICDKCGERYLTMLQEMKGSTWDKLPEMFLLKTWAELGRK